MEKCCLVIIPDGYDVIVKNNSHQIIAQWQIFFGQIQKCKMFLVT